MNGKLRTIASSLLVLASVSGTGKTISLWNVKKRELLGALEGAPQSITALAFSPDGTLLASGSWDNPARLWDVQKKKAIALLQTSGESVAFSPDGEWLATAQGPDRAVQIWKVATGELVAELKGHTGEVRAVAFSRNGRWLASTGRDGTVLLWEVNLPMTEAARVRVVIRDLSGRHVRTLDLGECPASTYLSREKAAYWDGRNDQGEPVSSGAYFYTLEAGDWHATRRLVIVR